jgi:ATP-binding cassette subfamily F protein uup
LLQYFLFTPEQQYNYVYKLSGGERRKLYLCTVLMRNPNFLVLDEPTNDLDIVTLQILEEYLQDFPGCVIVVSHDRYFMDKVVDHLLVFKGQGEIKDFPGNYTQYREWASLEENKTNSSSSSSSTSTAGKPSYRHDDRRRLSYKEKREMEQLEKDIAALEDEKKKIEEALCGGTTEVEEITAMSKRLPQLNDELDNKSFRWLELSEI